jgi:hypothetical protein
MDDPGLLGFDGVDFAVASLPWSRQFYVERLDFAETERASAARVAETGWPEYGAPWASRPFYTQIPIGELTESEAAELLPALLPSS